MKNYDHEWAKGELKKLNPDQKFDTMIKTVAIITKLLESEQLKPNKSWQGRRDRRRIRANNEVV